MSERKGKLIEPAPLSVTTLPETEAVMPAGMAPADGAQARLQVGEADVAERDGEGFIAFDRDVFGDRHGKALESVVTDGPIERAADRGEVGRAGGAGCDGVVDAGFRQVLAGAQHADRDRARRLIDGVRGLRQRQFARLRAVA